MWNECNLVNCPLKKLNKNWKCSSSVAGVTFQGLRSHTALATVLDSTAVIVEYSRGCIAYEEVGWELTGVRRKHQEDGGGLAAPSRVCWHCPVVPAEGSPWVRVPSCSGNTTLSSRLYLGTGRTLSTLIRFFWGSDAPHKWMLPLRFVLCL